MKNHILCLNSSSQFTKLIKQHLSSKATITFRDSFDFNQFTHKYSLIIIYYDLGLNCDFSEVRNIRDLYPDIPISALTDKHDKHICYKLLNLGVDSFITLNSPRNLIISQIKQLLRRNETNKPFVYEIGDIKLNKQNRSMVKDHREIYLKSKEFSIMEKLARHQNKIMDRYKLMPPELRESLNPDSARSSVDTHVSRIRKKLSRIGSDMKIKTVYGLGYKFQPQRTRHLKNM